MFQLFTNRKPSVVKMTSQIKDLACSKKTIRTRSNTARIHPPYNTGHVIIAEYWNDIAVSCEIQNV